MKKLCLLLYLVLIISPLFPQLNKKTGLLDNMRAIHIGGNWGRNPMGIPMQPPDYYQWLKSMSINWAAINIGLHVSNSMDNSVEKVYEGVQIPTFRDAPLRDAIRGFKARNINVLLTMAIETQEASQSAMPVNRWQFGDPNMPSEDSRILAGNWPWSTTHPQYASFTAAWWQSYTNEVVYFAKIAQQEGVKMFAVGAETDRLFRSRAGGGFTNHFQSQIKALVDSVKKYFSGLVTYEMHWSALADPAFYGPGSDYLWSDAGFDVVGVSAYFKLTAAQPSRVLGVDELEAGWNNIFTNYIIPLRNRNPGKYIVFHEFGYTDDLASPFNAVANEFVSRVFADGNSNQKDDGEEQQANIIDAFCRVNNARGRPVSALFLWDNSISSNTDWANSFGGMRTCSIRNKLAQSIITQEYISLTPLPSVPVPEYPPDNGSLLPQSIEFRWGASEESVTYELQVAEDIAFQNFTLNQAGLNTLTYNLAGLANSKRYYWRVRGKNEKGTGNWSAVFNFETAAPTGIEKEELPAEFIIYQNYPNPFNPETRISYSIPPPKGGNSKSSFVTVKIYDTIGRIVLNVMEEYKSPGMHTEIVNGKELKSGVYFCRITAGEYSGVVKLLLIK